MGKWHRVVVERNSLTGPGLARPALRVLLLGIGGLALAGTLLSGGAWLYLTGVWIPNTPSRAALSHPAGSMSPITRAASTGRRSSQPGLTSCI